MYYNSVILDKPIEINNAEDFSRLEGAQLPPASQSEEKLVLSPVEKQVALDGIKQFMLNK